MENLDIYTTICLSLTTDCGAYPVLFLVLNIYSPLYLYWIERVPGVEMIM